MAGKVTIGIPTYNRLAYLKEAAASALAQSWPELEVIVSNDAGDAEIDAWANARAARDPTLRYRRNPSKLGLAGNWNAIADSAQGKYLVLIGDDDRLLPDFVSRLMAAGEGADVIFCNHEVIDAGGARVPGEGERWSHRYGRDRLDAGTLARPALAVWRNSIPSSAALIRTELVRQLRFREDLNTPELELFARAAAQGARFVFVPEALAEYRVHGQSETSAGLKMERLVPYLESVAVEAEVEPLKRALLAPMLLTATASALARGDRPAARVLSRSRYFPSGGHAALQRACALAPGAGPLAYRSIRAMWRLFS